MKPILAHQTALRSEIQSFIAAKKSAAGDDIIWGKDLFDRLTPFSTSGKLLRGSIACFSYEAFSGQPPSSAVLKAAMALELAHSALLIHDDVMDKDDLRRGQLALHKQYESVAAKQSLSDGGHFGVSMAICGGDAALFLALELLAGSRAKPRILSLASQLFANRFAMVCTGQMQDLYLEASSAMPSKQAIYELMKVKTASYTIALPLEIGAAMAGQSGATLKTLRLIGEAAGTIFQIRDDELGVMGSTSKLGKPIGSDIKEGKKTLLYYYLWKSCSSKDRASLEKIFGNQAATVQEIKYVQKIVRTYKVAARLDNDVTRLRNEAFQQIDRLDLPDQSKKDQLKDLVAFCSTRQA